MRPAPTDYENTCEHCRKPLFGRTDKRFCNDTCRNTFNRAKAEREKIQAHENLPEIFRIIKKNYEILKKKVPNALHADESVFTSTGKFLDTGFNPRFFTSIHTTSNGETWYCCFECCFQIGEVYTFIKDFPEQATV